VLLPASSVRSTLTWPSWLRTRFSVEEVDQEERNEKPFARDDRPAETVLDLDVQPNGIEHAMDEVQKLRAIAWSASAGTPADRVEPPVSFNSRQRSGSAASGRALTRP